MVPAADWGHGFLQHQIGVLLDRPAKQQSLIATSSFNLGNPNNYRVPDHGFHRTRPLGVWNPTAAAVVEVLSPGDATFEKMDFYAAHGVEEVWIIDPVNRTVQCIEPLANVALQHSAVFDLNVASVAALIEWP